MRGVFVVALMLCAVQFMSAQIRIIPTEKLLEVAEPKVADTPLKLLSTEVDFGTIDEMSGVWQGSATLENMGEEPIAITQVKTTCGCLQASLAKRVIAPKERVAVTLKYYPRGHGGRVAQKVLVYTHLSTEKPSAILQLKGVVRASADRTDDFPYLRGVLRLRQERVQFDSEGKQIQRIACMNGGSSELYPKVDTLLTSKGLRIRFEPTKFAPKQMGNMIVEFNPNEVDADEKSLKIYLKLPNVAPRQSVVDVVVNKKD